MRLLIYFWFIVYDAVDFKIQIMTPKYKELLRAKACETLHLLIYVDPIDSDYSDRYSYVLKRIGDPTS